MMKNAGDEKKEKECFFGSGGVKGEENPVLFFFLSNELEQNVQRKRVAHFWRSVSF